MKKYLDERQDQIVNHIGAMAFYIMFFICAITIIVQIVFLDGGLSSVAGETLALLGGGVVYLAVSAENGVFLQKGKTLTGKENFIYSIICSGIFSALFGIAINGKAGPEVSIGKYIGIFFVGITVLGFAVLTIIAKCSECSQTKNGKKYED